jgi:transcriptional regulator with XRE-family HTH domain
MTQPRRGRPPDPVDPDASHAARLGAEIRARRQRRRLTLQALADLIGFSPQHISQVERAKAPASRAFVAACDNALEAGGGLLDLLPAVVCERALQRDERSAARHASAGDDEPAVATDGGSAALGDPVPLPLASQQEVGEDVNPLSRRSLLGAGAGAAVGLSATTAPAAARNVDPGLVEHWRTLLRLLDEHTAMFGPHDTLATIGHQLDLIAAYRRVARGRLCSDLLRVEARFSEYASWLCNDTGDIRASDVWAVRCLRLAKEAGDDDLVAYLLMWQSQWACERSEPQQAIAFAQAARRTRGATARILGLCAKQEAYGHALVGDADACQRCLADAHRLMADTDAAPPWDDLAAQNAAPHFMPVGEARCWLWLQPARAIALFDDALRIWPSHRPRSRSVQQARLALACVGAGEPDRAAAEGLKALHIAQATRADATGRELVRLDHRLAAYDTPAAAEFREAFGAL